MISKLDADGFFLAHSADENEDLAFGSDGEDSDYDPIDDQMIFSDTDEEAEPAPAIPLRNTALLRENLRADELPQKLEIILTTMDTLGINLPIFLDALSWGDVACTRNPKIRYARTSLMTSAELPKILRRWWKPPRSTSHISRVKGGREAMENFAAECTEDLLNRELEAVAKFLLSPAGEDIREENFTSIIFEELIESMKAAAPRLWSLLRSLAYTPKQERRNKQKDPEKVSINNNLHLELFITELYRLFSS